MSMGHAELLREMYGRRTLEEFAESLHPDAEMLQASVFPEPDDYYGRDGFVRGVRADSRNGRRFDTSPRR